jgi:hypothetical protein
MARGRIPEFESYHPSHAVVSSAVMMTLKVQRKVSNPNRNLIATSHRYARGARHFALARARSFAHLFQFGMVRLVFAIPNSLGIPRQAPCSRPLISWAMDDTVFLPYYRADLAPVSA